MIVPMADLQAQHRALKAELTEAFEQVMAACDFGGLGENTSGLEREIAADLRRKARAGRQLRDGCPAVVPAGDGRRAGR